MTYEKFVRGVRAHIVARVMNSFMPGRNWVGSNKSDMRKGWEALDAAAKTRFAAEIPLAVVAFAERVAKAEAEAKSQEARESRARTAAAELSDLGFPCIVSGGRIDMSVDRAETMAALLGQAAVDARALNDANTILGGLGIMHHACPACKRDTLVPGYMCWNCQFDPGSDDNPETWNIDESTGGA